LDKSIPRRKVTREQLEHLSDIYRMIAEQYLLDGRWDLIETTPPSADGRYASKETRRE
jgi:hypothetical protein